MTYSNFTRPLWSWLAGDAAHVNFFGTPLPGPNRTGAEDFLATHLDLAAAFSWDVRQQNMNALNSHDTARAATVMIDGGQRLGAVLHVHAARRPGGVRRRRIRAQGTQRRSLPHADALERSGPGPRRPPG